MPAQNTDRAEVLLAQVNPYLRDLLKSAPMFGSAGINLIFHEGQITRIDCSASVQRKPHTGGTL